MRILGIDLGRFNHPSHLALLHVETGETAGGTTPTTPEGLEKALSHHQPDLVVIEPCAATGWVADVCRSIGCKLLVANTNHPAWRWRERRRKSDELDARMLAQLAAMGQLGGVHVPELRIREWRGLIAYRARAVSDRVAIQNRIRWLLERHGVVTPKGREAWTQRERVALRRHGKALDQCGPDELWRGMLDLEFDRLTQAEEAIEKIEVALERLSEGDERVTRLRTIPGVGQRLAELVVALIDDPHRFRNGRQVAAYAGLVPRRYQSGETDRTAGIDKHGNRLLRAYLVEVSWLSLRHNQWARDTYDRIKGRGDVGKRRAIVALARHLLVRCWAMLRDRSDWREPQRSTAMTDAVA